MADGGRNQQSFVISCRRCAALVAQAKLESKDKCVLKDESLAEKEQLKDFVNYFMKVPGYNAGDLDGQTLNLPEHCQDYLKSVSGSSISDLLSSSAIKFQQFLPNLPRLAVGTRHAISFDPEAEGQGD